MASTLEFHNVQYKLKDGKIILQNVNFSVSPGETIVLLGRSGSGKTTLLKLINRMLELTSGEIIVESKSNLIWNPIELRRHIGYVIQEIGLFPHYTVEENIGIVPSLLNWQPNKIRRRVRELLKLVGLNHNHFASRYPHELSGGQSQRVGLARALAADPPILLLDEPFSALDGITRNELREELKALLERLEKTVIFVTHDVNEAFYLASRIGVFQKGKLICIDEPKNVQLSQDPEIKALLENLK